MLAALDDFLAATPPNMTPPDFRTAVQNIRSFLDESMVAVGVEYFRYYIPIRFVQFFVHSSDVLSEERLEYNIGLANQVFFPARMRFFLRDNNNIASYLFEDLYLRDANGEYILDAKGHKQDAYYTWPDDLTKAPPIHGIHYPQYLSCSIPFVRPEGNTEPRYWAQMRAGTYCCPEGEILVYINQGQSNGGQYPWYSRIIGMTAGHMARPGSNRNKFVFAHELVHYFGVPHTFPNHTLYSLDYDLARMIDYPAEGDPPPDQRRFYGPHEYLVNPETGQMAELSLFWDMFFVPVCPAGTMDTGIYQVFFNSRAEAAQYEGDLEPIEQWGNGRFYRETQPSCGESAQITSLELTVGAGCRGVKGDFSDCVCPAQTFCTGDHAVRAFSRPGSSPDKIQINVMSYGYPMADGTDVPDGMVEKTFISESQIEQIERVMDPDNDVDNWYFPGTKGLRPKLGSCTACHDLLD
jgi:hypothetical protein